MLVHYLVCFVTFLSLHHCMLVHYLVCFVTCLSLQHYVLEHYLVCFVTYLSLQHCMLVHYLVCFVTYLSLQQSMLLQCCILPSFSVPLCTVADPLPTDKQPIQSLHYSEFYLWRYVLRYLYWTVAFD